jgi:hypothetical protein
MRNPWVLLFALICVAGCSGHGANFTGASLYGVNFTGTDLSGAIFTGAKYDKCTRFPAGFNPSEHGMTLVEKQGDCAPAAATPGTHGPATSSPAAAALCANSPFPQAAIDKARELGLVMSVNGVNCAAQ